jgi:hypothetical protein
MSGSDVSIFDLAGILAVLILIAANNLTFEGHPGYENAEPDLSIVVTRTYRRVNSNTLHDCACIGIH